MWFGTLVASGFRLGNALVQVWDALQAEVGEVVDGPLASPVARAGAGFTKMQRLLTEAREKVRFQNLDVAFRSLPKEDMRRNAWMNLDKNSTVWVSAWPTKESYLSNPEFAEVVSTYLVCQAHAADSQSESPLAILGAHSMSSVCGWLQPPSRATVGAHNTTP